MAESGSLVGKGRVVAIANRKGGAGKTTLAVNLAMELALRAARVLLVDLDSQGHCALGLGIDPGDGALAVHRLFDGAARLGDGIRTSCHAGLDLAPADPRFEHGSGGADFGRLARALDEEWLRQRYDVILLDTPPSLDLLLLNALHAADSVLIPFVPHPLSLAGIRQLMHTFYQVRARHNPRLDILGFVPNLANGQTRQHRDSRAEVTLTFGSHQVLSPIRTDIRLAEAFARGLPIQRYAPSSRGAEDFRLLGERLGRTLGF